MDKPLVLNLNDSEDDNIFNELKNKSVIVDEIKEQIKELEVVKNPGLLANPEKIDLDKKIDTVWVYYPWKNTLVHCLREEDFKLLRKSRNKNLIIDVEQDKLENLRVGIAGLNVGNPGAICLALEGDIKMKLADNDVLSLSNLNRFRAGLTDLGINKATLTARQIYEINPFADLELFDKGIGSENIDGFLGDPQIDVLVEEMDNLPLKIKIRELARENRIPVVMVTGNGPNVIIDIERFDIEPGLELMSGYLKKEVINGISSGPKTFKEKMMLARDFMGVKYLHERLTESFDMVGSELAGIPQIAESSFLRGAAIAYAVRQIAQGASIKSGRYNLNMEKVYE
jgi:tRNA A37 threonylcarbamoyladenosine dehydratase